MIGVGFFLECIRKAGIEFFTGVPDSFLRPFCDTLMEQNGNSCIHQVAPNEGNALALAAGHYLATGKPACVYLQNSGIGNLYNPFCSLLHREVYQIPALLVIGWRGQPGLPDEPQHRFQGRATEPVLTSMEIPFVVLKKDMQEQDFSSAFFLLCQALAQGNTVAVLVEKGAFAPCSAWHYANPYPLNREEAIADILAHFRTQRDAFFVSSTGKISRELFEIRERNGETHDHDFLTVGSMGHTSSIALQIALEQPHRPVICLDGDGAALMHMGAMAMIGAAAPGNLIHVVLDNGAHETVGGMPTVSPNIDFGMIARGCGYGRVLEALDSSELRDSLGKLAPPWNQLTFLRIAVALGSRPDLGRPTGTPVQWKQANMKALQDKEGSL